MQSQPPPRKQQPEEWAGWAEASIQRPIYWDRSDGEKAAHARLLAEQAKTEHWNRGWSKFCFAVPLVVVSIAAGIFVGWIVF